MPKKTQDEHSLSEAAEKAETLKHLQETFAHQIDPDVVDFILSERDYNLESALEALLTLSNETEPETTEVLNLTDIIHSSKPNRSIRDIELNVERRQPSTENLYIGSNDIYHSNEALYTEDTQCKRNSGNFTSDFEPPQDRQCDTNITVEEGSKISNLIRKTSTLNVKSEPFKPDINDISPQSDCSIEADASDIIESTLNQNPNLNSQLEKYKCENNVNNTNNGTPASGVTPPVSCASNRPFYYYPFVSPGHSKVSPIYQYPFQPPSSYFHIMGRPKAIEAHKHQSSGKNALSPVEKVVYHTQQSSVKILILLRGLPGSGKSTLASKLVRQSGVTCSTDYFFTQRSRYNFDPAKLSEAHEWNQRRAKKFMEEGKTPIVIDNTNIEGWEMKPYVIYGQRYGYRIEILEPETTWKFKVNELALRNVHGITKEKIQSMLERYERNVTVSSILGLDRVNRSPKKIATLVPEDVEAKTNKGVGGRAKECRSSSSCESEKSFKVTRNFRRDDTMVSNFSKPILSLSQPTSPTKSWVNRSNRSPFKNECKFFADKDNLNDKDGDLSKFSAKLLNSRKKDVKPPTFKENVVKIQSPRPKMAGRVSPKRRVSPEVVESPAKIDDVKKNALDILKDDYRNEDDDFWSLSENEGKSESLKPKETSPQRARSRKRHSKGDLKTMEDIAQANIISHDFSMAASTDWCADDTKKPWETNKKEETNIKGNRTKIVASFKLPFVQYTKHGVKNLVDSPAQVDERDIFLSRFSSVSPHKVTQNRDICDKNAIRQFVPGRMDKIISTDDKDNEEENFGKMKELFPNLSEESLVDLFNKCHGNLEWASNLLLDSNHEYPKSNDGRSASNIDLADEKLVDYDTEQQISDEESSPDDLVTVIDSLAGKFPNFETNLKENYDIQKVISDCGLNDLNSESDIADGYDTDDDKRVKIKNVDEEDIVFQLHPSFATQLEHLFGPPCYVNQPQSSRQDLDIKINLNLAWQLHKCWAKTLQKKLFDEDCEFARKLQDKGGEKVKNKAKPKRSISLDRKNAKGRDRKETSRSLNRLEKRDSEPNMNEIMDMEMALQLSKNDAVEQYQKMWNDVDIATKMKRKLLYERYPFLEKDSLDEVFAANDFSLPQTEDVIKAAFGGRLPKQPEVQATKSEGERSGLVRKLSTSQEVIKPSEFPVINDMKDFRAQSVLYHQLRSECFNKAQEAFRSGNYGAASFYSQQGHTYTQKMWEANRHASLEILLHRNFGKDDNTIDLHLLYVREALEMLDMFLRIKVNDLRKGHMRKVTISIITGRGKHSVDQVPRLKLAVINYLSKRNITYHEKHAGLLEVVLTRAQTF